MRAERVVSGLCRVVRTGKCEDNRRSFDSANHDMTVICSAQDDTFWVITPLGDDTFWVMTPCSGADADRSAQDDACGYSVESVGDSSGYEFALGEGGEGGGEVLDKVGGFFEADVQADDAAGIIAGGALQFGIGHGKRMGSAQLQPMPKSFRDSTKVLTWVGVKRRSKTIEKMLLEPVKSRCQNSWPGQDCRAG